VRQHLLGSAYLTPSVPEFNPGRLHFSHPSSFAITLSHAAIAPSQSHEPLGGADAAGDPLDDIDDATVADHEILLAVAQRRVDVEIVVWVAVVLTGPPA
jgi:hypothetical protein